MKSNLAIVLSRFSSQDKDIKWDEMNILQTLHPPDKDYGHMKIEEPKTPYSYFTDDGEGTSDNEKIKELDPENLAELITKKTKEAFSFEDAAEKISEAEDDDMDDEDLTGLTEEERERRKDFDSKRKKHYNEYQMVKLARKLMEEEMNEVEHEHEESTDQPEASTSSAARPDA